MEEAGLRNIYARGVYWPWERTGWVAEKAGMQLWDFVAAAIKNLKEDFSCNVIWFVNIGLEDAARVCDLAEKYEVKVLPNINPLLNLGYNGMNSPQALRKAAREAFTALGQKKALGAYVLIDEPRRVMTGQIELFRKEMKKIDPDRDCIVVSMNRDTEAYAHQTNLPVVCVDIYPFGGDRSPNIPNPAPASQNYYRGALTALAEAALRNNKKLWVMPQAFAENWGPWWYDENMNVVIEPGTYRHWRMPILPEIRWQIWEGVRAGSQGFVFFVLLPSGNDWDGKDKPPVKMVKMAADVREKKWPVTEKQVRTGSAEALLYKNGSATPQMKEAGRVFALLSKMESLLSTWQPADFPVAFVEETFKTGTFLSGTGDTCRFLVVVNDNLEETVEKDVFFLPNVRKITDLISGKELSIVKGNTGEFLQTRLSLEAGGGTILKVEFQQDEPGFLTFEEDFSLASLGVKLNEAFRKPMMRPFSTGWDWVVEKEKEAPAEAKGVIVLENVSKPFPSPVAGVLTSSGSQFEAYLFVEGKFHQPESLIVEWHGNDGKRGWLMSNNYHLPVRLFPGLKEVRLLLSDGVRVSRILVWVIPKPESQPKF
ncbi:MAG TPA: hypothetical protein PKW42_00890 [bacterium]|nr:hypothetical protein [bacterium]